MAGAILSILPILTHWNFRTAPWGSSVIVLSLLLLFPILKYGNRRREVKEASQMAAYDGGMMVTQGHLEPAQTSRAGSLIHPGLPGHQLHPSP